MHVKYTVQCFAYNKSLINRTFGSFFFNDNTFPILYGRNGDPKQSGNTLKVPLIQIVTTLGSNP